MSEANQKSTAQMIAKEAADAAQRRERVSKSREFAATALGQLDKDPERGLLIAIEAGMAADTNEAQDALRQLLLVSSVKPELRGQERIADIIALAQSRVTRKLTCEERLTYLHEDRVCATPTPEAAPTP